MSKCKTRSSTIHGIGLFAKQDIAAGEVILLEAPLLTIPNEVFEDERARAKFIVDAVEHEEAFAQIRAHCLATRNADKARPLSKENLLARSPRAMTLLLMTVLESGLDVGGQRVLFNKASWLNHSCKPNVESSWIDANQQMAIKATRDIVAGEEILTTYFVNVKRPLSRWWRRQELLKGIEMICNCDVCSLVGDAADVAEDAMTAVSDWLAVLAGFRSHHFGKQEPVNLFARAGDRPLMYEEAKAVCEEAEDWGAVLREAIEWVKQNAKLYGLAHSSLALVHEVESILHGAEALCSSVLSDGSLGSAQITHMVSTPDFLAALEAKLQQFEGLNTCLGMWHPRVITVTKELMGMWFTGGNNAPSHVIVKRLQAMGLSVKSCQDEDGR